VRFVTQDVTEDSIVPSTIECNLRRDKGLLRLLGNVTPHVSADRKGLKYTI